MKEEIIILCSIVVLLFTSCKESNRLTPIDEEHKFPNNELKVGNYDPLLLDFGLYNKEELADNGGVENYLTFYGNITYDELDYIYEMESNQSIAILTLYFRSDSVLRTANYSFSSEAKIGVLLGGDLSYYPTWAPKRGNESAEYYTIISGVLKVSCTPSDYLFTLNGKDKNDVPITLFYYGEDIYFDEHN